MKQLLLLLLLLILIPSCNESDQPEISEIPKVNYLSYAKYKAQEAKIETPDNAVDGMLFTAPQHWQKEEASGMRLLSYIVADKKKFANFTLIKLIGRSGSIRDNVNRWRGQLNLKPISQARLNKALKQIPTESGTYQFIDIQRIQKRGQETDRILAAILTKGETTYFFKLMGPHTLIENEKQNFLEFLEKIKDQKDSK